MIKITHKKCAEKKGFNYTQLQIQNTKSNKLIFILPANASIVFIIRHHRHLRPTHPTNAPLQDRCLRNRNILQIIS